MEQNDKHEILEAINIFSEHVDQQFKNVDQQFKSVDQQFKSVNQQFKSVDQQFKSVDQQFKQIRSEMVTKDYLDEKLADFRGDLVVLVRKEDKKFGALLAELVSSHAISQEAAKRILSMEPFAQS